MGSFNASLKTIGDRQGLSATIHLTEGRLKIAAGEADIGEWSLDEIGLEPTPTGYRLAAEGEQLLIEMPDRDQFAAELSEASKKTSKLPGLSVFKSRRKESKASPNGDPVAEVAKSRVDRPAEPHIEPKVEAEAETENPTPSPISRLLKSSDDTDPQNSEPAPADRPSRGPIVLTPTPDSEAKTSKKGKRRKKKADKKLTEKTTRSVMPVMALLDRVVAAGEKRWGSLLPDWFFSRTTLGVLAVWLLVLVIFPSIGSMILLVVGLLAVMLGGAAYTDDMMASRMLPGRMTPTHVLILGVSFVAVGLLLGFVGRQFG